ncbi:MAG: ribonuclease H-like domain-containing protein [Aridibacter sp.]
MNILITRTSAEINLAYEKLKQAKILGCDTETSGLNPRKSRLFSVQFSDGDFNVLVPTSENVPLGKLAEILEDEKIVKIFHNAKFDLGFLQENGYQTKNVYDTMIAEKVLTKGANQSISLAETLYRHFAVDLDKSQRKKFGRNWDRIWTNELVEYAINDVAYLPKLMEDQILWMERLGLRKDFEMLMRKII